MTAVTLGHPTSHPSRASARGEGTMSPFGKFGLVAAVSILVAAIACRDGTAPVAPRELMIMAGDSQAASLGEVLPTPLRVRVIGVDGRPLRGATVRWSVTRGEATVEPAQSNTDAFGDAETRVTVGGIVGAGSVSATVLDVPPVGFALEATDPCTWFPPLAVLTPGEVAGRLQPLDCEVGDGSFRDHYSFAFSNQQALSFRLRAGSFDPLMALYIRGGTIYWQQGHIPGDHDFVFKAILAPGAYLISAGSTAPNMTGPYVLSVGPASPSADGCEFVVVVRGITSAQELVSSDCTRENSSYYEDIFWFFLWAGESVVLTQSSTQFVPRLRLLGGNVTEAVGSADGTATIRFTSEGNSWYAVDASSDLSRGSGAYTLTVSDPSVGTAGAAPPSEAGRLGLLGSPSRFDRRAIAAGRRIWRP
jgi:hypothetical protein